MKTSIFEKNILAIYGKEGQQWLAKIPNIIAEISQEWLLTDLQLVENLTYNYVVYGMRQGVPIVLKLSVDYDSLAREHQALKLFTEKRVVKILNYKPGALLLNQLKPGYSLKKYFPRQEDEIIHIFCSLLTNLHSTAIPSNKGFLHIREQLLSLDQEWPISHLLLNEARVLKKHLLATTTKNYFLHGDLHHDNILYSNGSWIAIDPRGIEGDAIYDIAAFIRNPMPDLLELKNYKNIILGRVATIARILSVDELRIIQWSFVQAVLAWVWTIEDNGNTDYAEHLTALFAAILKI